MKNILSRDVIFTREAEGLKGKYYIFETKYVQCKPKNHRIILLCHDGLTTHFTPHSAGSFRTRHSALYPSAYSASVLHSAARERRCGV